MNGKKTHPDVQAIHEHARTWDNIAQVEAEPLFGREHTAGLDIQTKMQPITAALATKVTVTPTPSIAIKVLINVCKNLAPPKTVFQCEQIQASVASKK